MNPGSGILLVDKPAGVTSFDVVNQVRKSLIRSFPALRATRVKGKGGHRPPRFKCGHAGTLDPLATGLLLVMVGRGSRISQFLLGLDKTYLATVRFGLATETLDRDGTIICKEPVSVSLEAIKAVLPRFIGNIEQIPPIISALKVDGKALYKRARAGENVPEPDARPVTINELVLKGARWGFAATNGLIPAQGIVHEVDLLVRCGSGTYIRSLARDIAVAAGTVGHIHELRRIDVGPFQVQNAVSDIMNIDGQAIGDCLQPLAEALPHIPCLALGAHEAGGIRQGQQPQADWLSRLDRIPRPVGKSGCLFRMLDGEGKLVAVGIVEEETGQPRIALVIPAELPAVPTDGEGSPTCE